MPELNIKHKASVMALLKRGWLEKREVGRLEISKSTVQSRRNRRHYLEGKVGTDRIFTEDEDEAPNKIFRK